MIYLLILLYVALFAVKRFIPDRILNVTLGEAVARCKSVVLDRLYKWGLIE